MEGLIWINENLHSNGFLNHLFKFITFLSNTAIFWIILAVVLLLFKKTRTSALVMMVALLVGFILNDFVFKNIFARPRPFAVNQDIADFIVSINLKFPSGFSFPSGHSYASFNCAVLLMCFNKKMGFLTIPVASLIAFSRVFLCVHYPTDVLVGAILGILTALLVYYCYQAIVRKYVNNKRNIIRKEAYKS